MVLFFGCTHQGENGTLPKVKTGNVFFCSSKTFVASGLVESYGSGVIKYGFCWSTSNNKPDINDSHTDEVNHPTYDAYYPSIGESEHQAFFSGTYINEDESPSSLNTIIYVRAYAMTAEGKYVYGKTVSCTMGDENTLYGKLVWPNNGWILQSTSLPANVYLNGLSSLQILNNFYLRWPQESLDVFQKGSSEYLSEPSLITLLSWNEDIGAWGASGSYDILSITKNELRLRTINPESFLATDENGNLVYDEYGHLVTGYTGLYELTFVPAP